MKILVIYATAGAGHKMAGQALYNRLKTLSGVDARFVDALEHTNPFYKHLYSTSYTWLITKTPWLWGFFFWLLDIPFLQPLVLLARRVQNTLNAWRLSQFFQKEDFDYIFSTHFFPNEVAGYLKRTGKIRSTIICSVTDFDVHRIWLAKGVDYYTVASDWTKQKMLKLGVPGDRVFVTGIPTDEKFSLSRDISGLKKKLGIQEGVFTVLVATGSFGIGPIEEIIDVLSGFQVMVVCGHNKALYERLRSREKGLVKIFGLVNNMDELMAVSNAMVTKPGGLSISEALVTGLPMIFFNAIPGQETNNIKVLKEHGIGMSDCTASAAIPPKAGWFDAVLARGVAVGHVPRASGDPTRWPFGQGRLREIEGRPLTIAQIAEKLRRFQNSPQEFQAAREKIKNLARPSAVKDIVSLIK